MPESINLSACEGCSSVLELSQSVQLVTTGTLADGSQQDVTPRTAWTTYRTSNPAIATINGDGLVTAAARGTAFITAVNEGATAVKRITVVETTITTTVEGFVQLQDGTPVAGATVTNVTFGGSATTDASGFFSFGLVVGVDTVSLTIQASAEVQKLSFVGAVGGLPPMADGITDAGLITLVRSGNGSLFPGRQFGAGRFPLSVAIGDLDGDGDADLAVANELSDNVSVLLNNGDGTFAAALNFGAGLAPFSVAIGDLDGDGDADLAVANELSSNVLVLLNRSIP